MNLRQTSAVIIGLFCCVTSVLAQQSDPVAQALRLAGEKNYAQAEAILQKQRQAHPDNPDIQAAQATVLLWKNDYIQARPMIDRLVTTYPQNPDYLLLRANENYYQGNLDAAEKDYAAIVAQHPDYAEAREGLNNIHAQKTEQEGNLWRLDTGYGISTFEHSNQPDWNHGFVQITRALDDQNLLIHARAERFDQYKTINTLYEIGATRKFSQALYGDLALAGSPEALYKPQVRLQAGINGRMTTEDQTYFPLWLPVTYQDDWYTTVENRTFSAGPLVAIADDWNASAKMIYTYQVDGKATKGWIAQLDGRFVPSLRFTAGYSYAPDLELSSLTPVYTAFGALMYDVTEQVTARVDYAREDRSQSYTRNVVDVSFSYKF